MNSEVKPAIHVDVGGTFTDCFVRWGDKTASAKAPTTGYNLSVGFMQALREATTTLEMPLSELLRNCEIITYATTIAMNTLIQRTGPKLALICTQGFEDIIPIGKGSSWSDSRTVKEIKNIARIEKPEPLIPRSMTVGVKERIDEKGNVLWPLVEEDFLEKLRYLVDQGARGFVVSLIWSFMNPIHERRIKEIIEQEYPDSYLGAMPVVLSSQICAKRLEYTRTVTTVLNTYLHESMWEQLCGMGDELRDLGYDKAIQMIHNSGGMAEVFRTAAIQTFNGGPIAGLIGGSYLAEPLGYENVIVADMGGTSFDISTIVAGSARFYEFRPIIDRWWVDLSMLESRSIGAGGGSIAQVNPLLGNAIQVGPLSAGSMPGPAAYDLGGTEPTVTDADVVLGHINPDYYFGGRMKLNREKAEASIREKIAQPAQIDSMEAAARIKKIVDANMGDAIMLETYLRGYDPKNFVLFACGGAGPAHCCGFSDHIGVRRIVVFPFSSVYCAFGSNLMDVTHSYEKTKRLQWLAYQTTEPTTDYEEFNSVVAELKQVATRDMVGEGFDPESITFRLELDMQFGEQVNVFRTTSPLFEVHSAEDVMTVYEQFEREYADYYSPYIIWPKGGVEVLNFVLWATAVHTKYPLPTHPMHQATPPKEASKGKREVYWEEFMAMRKTPIYEENLLQPGNIIEGPAIIEAETTTVVVDPSWQLSVDEHRDLILDKQ